MDPLLLDRFRSSVLEAVLEALALSKPLLVFLSRQDSVSDAFISSCLPPDSVSSRDIKEFLESEFVLLRLLHGTQEYGFFEEVFGNSIVPSICIVRHQALVDVIHGDVTAEEFARRVHATAALHTETPTPIIAPSSNSASPERSNGDRPAQDIQATSQPNVLSTFRNITTSDAEESSPSESPMVSDDLEAESKGTIRTTSSHEESVRKHKLEIRAKKRQQAEEKLRLRVLLESDRREVALRFQALQNTARVCPVPADVSKGDRGGIPGVCTLLIKFFDGSSVRRDFQSVQTLDDVRKWLDTESEVEIIPSTELLPLFASSPYLQPVQYVFHLPELPRITYSSEDESKSLADLGLCPRSALILKPIYEDANPDSVDFEGLRKRPGILSNLRHGLGMIGGALYSFFDYGANQDHIHLSSDDENDPENDQEGLAPVRSLNLNQVGRPLILGSATPSLLLIHPHVSAGPSLINIEDSSSGEPTRPTRPSTPHSLSQPGNIKRMGLKFGEVASDRSDEETETYNGNTVNLDQRKDDD